MELDIKQIFFILLKKLPVILACSIITGLLSFTYTGFFVIPRYASTATLCIQASENREDYKSVTTADFSVSSELVETIKELVKSDSCLKMIAEVSDLKSVYTPNQIKGMISVVSNGTETFKVRASCSNPEHSLLIVNAFAEVISDSTLVDGNVVDSDNADPNRGYIKKVLKAGTVILIDRAKSVPTKPSSPNLAKNTLYGFVIGFLLTAIAYIVYEALTIKIITEEDISSTHEDIPALGSIPLIVNEKGGVEYGQEQTRY